jgi:hypothetical protein
MASRDRRVPLTCGAPARRSRRPRSCLCPSQAQRGAGPDNGSHTNGRRQPNGRSMAHTHFPHSSCGRCRAGRGHLSIPRRDATRGGRVTGQPTAAGKALKSSLAVPARGRARRKRSPAAGLRPRTRGASVLARWFAPCAAAWVTATPTPPLLGPARLLCIVFERLETGAKRGW